MMIRFIVTILLGISLSLAVPTTAMAQANIVVPSKKRPVKKPSTKKPNKKKPTAVRPQNNPPASTTVGFATNTSNSPTPATSDNGNATNNNLWENPEVAARFPGGDAAMLKYINDNLRYPANAQENGIQGRVIINFLVETDGSLSEVKVVRGADPDLDKEALRLVKKMPRWTPGKMNGKPVRTRNILPITFRIK